MNRRDFLLGCTATASVAISGPVPAGLLVEVEPFIDIFMSKWLHDIANVYSEHHYNIIVFGFGILQHTEEYPYVRNIHPREINVNYLDRPSTGGLL